MFISDESHHINSYTKKKTKDEQLAEASWERTVMRAFKSNKNNILLEFTATADLKDKNVLEKYKNHIIFNYPLSEFRLSGYTKDFQNFATNSNLWERTLIALVLSEYRKQLFSELKINIKPVILLKSQTIKESESFYVDFYKRLKELSVDELNKLKESNQEYLIQALDYFTKLFKNNLQLLIESLQSSFSKDNSIIMNGASDGNEKNNLLVNSLEDKSNPIRIIFAVDMLNEGWDVLNLFDIVRLYDTRQGSGITGKIGSYTIREAQLIGRGARYCPFSYNNELELKYKRKFDYDLTNKYRILETMLFHSQNDSKYISELKRALIATGLQPENPITIEYKLKDDFTKTDFYKNSLVYSNKRIPKSRLNIVNFESSLKNLEYGIELSSISGITSNLFSDAPSFHKTITKNPESIISFTFKDMPYNVLEGASAIYPSLRFDNIKKIYPQLTSLKEFLTSDHYLGSTKLNITNKKNSTSGKDLFEACTKAFTQISKQVSSIKQEFVGDVEFNPSKLENVLKNKKIFINSKSENGGHGNSQKHTENESLRLDLSNVDWYVFEDNYGTEEEKLFIKFFKTFIDKKFEEPQFKNEKLEFYLIRNERIPELAIYSFKDGSRFEPDYLLFVKGNENNTFQAYIEPKGSHLIATERWKEEFLLDIKEKHKVKKDLINDNFHILGMPFFNNSEDNKEIFTKALNDFFEHV